MIGIFLICLACCLLLLVEWLYFPYELYPLKSRGGKKWQIQLQPTSTRQRRKAGLCPLCKVGRFNQVRVLEPTPDEATQVTEKFDDCFIFQCRRCGALFTKGSTEPDYSW